MNKQLQFLPPLSRGLKQFTLLLIAIILASNVSVKAQVFYSASTGLLNSTVTWWSNPDGATGTHPTAVAGLASTTFHVANGNIGSFGSSTILGSGSKLAFDNAGTTASQTSYTLQGSNVTGTFDVGPGIILTCTSTPDPLIVGTISSTSTVVYNKASSSVVPAGSYGNLIIGDTVGAGNSSTRKAAAGTITVNGTLTIAQHTSSGFDLTTNSATLVCKGNVTYPVSGTPSSSECINTGANGTLTFSGGTNQNVAYTIFTGNGAAQHALNITNNSTVTITGGAASSPTFAAGTTLNIGSGSSLVLGANSTLTLSGGTFTANGTIDASLGNMAFAGTYTVPAGLFVSNNIKNLTLTSGTLTWNQSVTNITGALALTAGTLGIGANTFNIGAGATSTTGVITASGAGVVKFNGSANQTIGNIFSGTIPNITVANTGGAGASTVTLGGSTTVGTALTLTSGSLALSAGTLTVAGAINRSGGTLAASPAYSGVVNVTDAGTNTSGPELTGTGGSIGVLAVSSGTYTLASAPTIGSLTVASGATIDAGTNIITPSATGINITGTFKHANTAGFTGSTTTAISNVNTPAITLNSGSTVTYTGAGTAPVSSGTYSNLMLNNGGSINGSTTVSGTLTIGSNQLLNLNGNTLTINDVASTGAITGSATSGIVTTGALSNPLMLDQTSTATSTLGTLTLGGNATLGNAVNMAAGATPGTVNVTSGTLTTGGNLTLLSDANGTARIGAVTAGAISGSVNIQRFVPGQRGYRLLGHPYTSNLDLSQLYATFDITGLTGNAGATCTGTNASAFSYTPGTGAYVAITGTGAGAFPKAQSSGSAANGILAFVRGSKGQGCTSAATTSPSDITFTTASGVNQGDVTETIPVGWNIISNPFPSQVLLSTVDNIGSLNALEVVEPGVQNSGNTYTNGTGYFAIDGTYILPINGAILANNTSGSPISIVFHESSKRATAPVLPIFKTTNVDPTVQLSVYKANSLWDMWHLSMKPGATGNAKETGDLDKFSNTQFNISSMSTDAKQLAWDARDESDITDGTIVPMNISSALQTTYTIQVSDYSLPNDKTVYLHDKYTNAYVLLNNGTTYPLTVNGDAASQGANRIELLFNVSNNTTGIGNVNNATSAVSIMPNPASTNISLNYNKTFAGAKTISIINAVGQVVKTLSSSDANVSIFVGDMPGGVYLVKTTTGNNVSTERFIKN